MIKRYGANGDGAASACSWRRRSGGCSSTRRSRPTSRSWTASLKKRDLTEVDRQARRRVPAGRWWPTSLDKLKDLGFEFATRAGLTISISDIKTPDAKKALLDQFEAEAERVEQQYDRGIITDDERRQKEIEIWTEATDQVRDAMQAELRPRSSTPSR